MSGAIGKPVSRLDGYEKTMGRARYTGDIILPNMAHAAIVGATISSGGSQVVSTKVHHVELTGYQATSQAPEIAKRL